MTCQILFKPQNVILITKKIIPLSSTWGKTYRFGQRFEPTSSWCQGLVLHHWATLPSWENKQNWLANFVHFWGFIFLFKVKISCLQKFVFYDGIWREKKLLKDLKPQNISDKKSHLPLNFNLDPPASEAKLLSQCRSWTYNLCVPRNKEELRIKHWATASPTCFTVAILVEVHDLNSRYQYGFGTFFESLCSYKL